MTMLCLSKHSWKQPCSSSLDTKSKNVLCFIIFFNYNIFVYFIQITLNVLHDLWGGKGNSLIWAQQDVAPCP